MAICGLLQTTKLKRIIFLSLLMGDFNLTIENKHLEISLITSPLYFQFTNPTCIDLTLTNQEDLTHVLQKIKNSSYRQFEKAFVTVLDNHVPLKKKQLIFNHDPFMTKESFTESYNDVL